MRLYLTPFSGWGYERIYNVLAYAFAMYLLYYIDYDKKGRLGLPYTQGLFAYQKELLV